MKRNSYGTGIQNSFFIIRQQLPSVVYRCSIPSLHHFTELNIVQKLPARVQQADSCSYTLLAQFHGVNCCSKTTGEGIRRRFCLSYPSYAVLQSEMLFKYYHRGYIMPIFASFTLLALFYRMKCCIEYCPSLKCNLFAHRQKASLN